MTSLHLLQHPHSLSRARPCIAEGDAVVYFAPSNNDYSSDADLPTAVKRYCLAEPAISGGKLINYSELVALCTQYTHCLSW